jgi:xylan 1,4-beta-xylosidase
VGDEYYIATSTFEWFPGVQIHHSRDLINWSLRGRPLNRVSQLDMKGVFPSGGVWAPALTWHDGLFWLVYTNVQSFRAPVFDTPNYLVTSPSIDGPWSEPVYLNSSGFDPSIFHDDDGRSYIVNMQMGEIGQAHWFDGIVIQEYDRKQQELVGEITELWRGIGIDTTEGPHILKRNGWYYLITAEGGTGVRHRLSVARSRKLRGPYEAHPDGPLLTSFNQPGAELSSCGHGNLIEGPNGQWIMVHLCNTAIPKPGEEPCDQTDSQAHSRSHVAVLGRQTGIQLVDWGDDGWPRKQGGGCAPDRIVEIPVDSTPAKADAWDSSDDFSGEHWDQHFQTLREPADESWISLSKHPGCLSLRGRNTLFSAYEQSLLARRLQHLNEVEVSCSLSYQPSCHQQAAGLIIYCDYENFKYLRLTAAGDGLVKVGVVDNRGSEPSHSVGVLDCASIPQPERLWLRARIRMQELTFAWSTDGNHWIEIPETYATTDLGNWAEGVLSEFTGTFCGISCQDTQRQNTWARFHHFSYRGR